MLLNNSKGTLLLESLVTLVILSVLMSIALPSFEGAIKRNAAETDSRLIHHALLKAQSLAITRGESVTLCYLKDSECDTGPGQVLHIAVRDSTDTAKPKAKKLKALETVPLRSKSIISGSFGVPKITFNALGHTQGPGTVVRCVDNTLYLRVTVNRIGRSYRKTERTDEPTKQKRYRKKCSSIL